MRKAEMVNDIADFKTKIDKRVNALTEYLEVEFAPRPAEPEKIVVEKKKKKTS